MLISDGSSDVCSSDLATGSLTALQLHGREPPERAATIRRRFGIPVWKAISVKTRADIEAARAYAGAADFILFDARTPHGSALPGGMGLRFDWTLLRGAAPSLPWGLSDRTRVV